MTRHEPSPHRLWSSPKTLGRVLIAAAGVSVFLFAAKTIDPGASSASTALPLATPVPSPEPISNRVSLGRFQGNDHALHIVATPEGPRYTITDAAGNILESLLHTDELNSALESHGIEIGQPADNAPGALMLTGDVAFDDLLD